MTSWAHTGYLVRYLKQFGYIKQRKTRNGKIHRHNKSLVISNELHSVTRSGVLDYILKRTQYKKFPQKKKRTKEKDRKRSVIGRKEKKKRDKGERQKEECDREKKKRGQRRKTEKEEADEKAVEEERREKRKERRRGRKEEEEDKKKNRESSTKDAPPPPNAFPSQKLGNNMTPIKGRLGKNTTPTHGDLEKLVQRCQRSPSEDSRTSSIHPMRTSSTHYEKQNLQKRRIQRQHNHHL